MTEPQLQAAVIEAAQRLGWRVAHFRPARTAKGWRTPVSGDGAGFPDLLMVRDGLVIAAELKSARGRVSLEQEAWLAVFRTVSACSTYVWRPGDWADGTVEAVLRW